MTSIRQANAEAGNQVSIVPAGLSAGQQVWYDQNTPPFDYMYKTYGGCDTLAVNLAANNATVVITLDGQTTKTYLFKSPSIQSQYVGYFKSMLLQCVAGSFSTGDLVVYIAGGP